MKRMMKPLVLAFALSLPLFAAACTTPGEEAAQAQARLAADKAECARLGFKEGTDDFSNCLLKLREIRAIKAETRSRDLDRMNRPWWPYYSPGYPPYYWR
ncbi:hypothetical protein [Parvibaculum sp. MBR-TMA-1.3b-4.2]|jgi:hypothetical protein